MKFIDKWQKIWLFGLLSVGLFLLIDGLFLIVFKRINLGSILPTLIGIFLLFHGFFWQKIQLYLANRIWQKRCWQLGWGIFIIWLISLFSFFITLQQHITKSEQTPPVKAILVLGSGFKNGKPSPTLANRLDTSAKIAKQQPNSLIVLTGGLGFNETLTEAEVMAKYLNETHGIDYQRMALENQSTSTELNLKNSQPILAKHGIHLTEPILIVSSDFHTLRAEKIAKKLGYQDISTAGSATPLSIRYNVWLREYFAFASGWVLNEY